MADGDEKKGKLDLHVSDVQPLTSADGTLLGVKLDVHRACDCVSETASGPAKVATAAYREGYDRIFGGRAERGVA